MAGFTRRGTHASLALILGPHLGLASGAKVRSKFLPNIPKFLEIRVQAPPLLASLCSGVLPPEVPTVPFVQIST